MIRNTEIVLVAYYKTESCFIFSSYFYCFEPVVKNKTKHKQTEISISVKKNRMSVVTVIVIIIVIIVYLLL